MDVPDRIVSDAAWRGPDLAPADWMATLSTAEADEIERATLSIAERNIDLIAIRKEDFPLPTFGARLARITGDVLEGRGFALIRGLDIARYDIREAAIAFLGIGSHIGSARSQNANGHILGHVKDLGLSSADPNVRIYQTHERQTYHTDSCDIVGLMCLKTAKSGGLSSLVSSVTIYNEMRRVAPELVRTLFEPIETDRRGEVDAGSMPYFRIPVFNWYEGLLSTIYQRQYIESARRFPNVPALTQTQIAALDLFDKLANDEKLAMQMELQPGDVQLVNNHALLHDRTSFVDFSEPERRRHLLRLWLAPDSARPLPPVFAERFGSVTPGARGGITVPGLRLVAPLEP